MTAGWHSWGRQITLGLFELTKQPSPPLRRGKTTSPGFACILFIPFYPFLLSPRTPLSFIQPFILLFHNPCPSYIPHPFQHPLHTCLCSRRPLACTWPASCCCQQDDAEIHQCVTFFGQNRAKGVKRYKMMNAEVQSLVMK